MRDIFRNIKLKLFNYNSNLFIQRIISNTAKTDREEKLDLLATKHESFSIIIRRQTQYFYLRQNENLS